MRACRPDEIERRLILLITERNLTAAGQRHRAHRKSGVHRRRRHSHLLSAARQDRSRFDWRDVTATCQTVLEQHAAGHDTRPTSSAIARPACRSCRSPISSDTLTEAAALRLRVQLHHSAARHGAGRPRAPAVRRQADAGDGRPRSRRHSTRGACRAADVSRAVNAQNLILPAGHREDRRHRIQRDASTAAPDVVEAFNHMPVKTVNGATGVRARRGPSARRVRGANERRASRRQAARVHACQSLKGEGASTLDVVERVRQAMPELQAQLPPEVKIELMFDQSVFVQAAVEGVIHEARHRRRADRTADPGVPRFVAAAR